MICLGELAVLHHILQPSAKKVDELTAEVMRLLSAYQFGLGHQESQVALKVDVWVSALKKYPLYAIKRAAKWCFEGERKEPALCDFMKKVELAHGWAGEDVLMKKRMLENLLVAQKEDGNERKAHNF